MDKNLLEKETFDSSVHPKEQYSKADLMKRDKTSNGEIERYIHMILKKHKWCAIFVFVLCRKTAFYFCLSYLQLKLRKPLNFPEYIFCEFF